MKNMTKKRRFSNRQKGGAKFQLPPDSKIEYKNISLLQKFLNDRGKMIPRRISGVTAKEQRMLAQAIRRARFLALLTSGGVKK